MLNADYGPKENLCCLVQYVFYIVWNSAFSICLFVCLFVFHHKKITKNFKMGEVLMRPRCAIAMLLVKAPA